MSTNNNQQNQTLPKFCPHCGATVNGASTICAVCGKSLLTYGPADNTQNTYSYPPLEEDVATTPYKLLAFFVPVAGVVLYAMWSGQYPNKSKAVGKWALIGFLAPLVIWLVFVILMFLIMFLSVAFTN
jgi:predicted amidophosphoribosyltransferase